MGIGISIQEASVIAADRERWRNTIRSGLREREDIVFVVTDCYKSSGRCVGRTDVVDAARHARAAAAGAAAVRYSRHKWKPSINIGCREIYSTTASNNCTRRRRGNEIDE